MKNAPRRRNQHKKNGPIAGAKFKEDEMVGDVRKGDASGHSA
jgi:hypothetical protein